MGKNVQICPVPLGDIFGEPPLKGVRHMSDAAGAAFEWTDGHCKNITEEGGQRGGLHRLWTQRANLCHHPLLARGPFD